MRLRAVVPFQSSHLVAFLLIRLEVYARTLVPKLLSELLPLLGERKPSAFWSGSPAREARTRHLDAYFR